jgi:hypothetical protein
MTEAEWLECGNPRRMLEYLGRIENFSQRKLRLFAVACCREIVHLCPEPQRLFLTGLEAAERFADGLISEAELTEADEPLVEIERRLEDGPEDDSLDVTLSSCKAVGQTMCLDEADHPYLYRMADVILHVTNAVAFESCPHPWDERNVGLWTQTAEAKKVSLAAIVREIFGNPFCPITFPSAWRTSDVMLLAQGIYDAKAFDQMPILADALQDAGCDSEDILAHCREAKQAHVRGCWVVDLVLGKE